MEILTFIRLFNENKKNIKIIQIPSKTSFFPASLYTLYTILYLYPYTPLYTPIYPPKPYIAHSGRLSGYLYTPIYPYIPPKTPIAHSGRHTGYCTIPPIWDAYPGVLYSTPNLGRVSGHPAHHPQI